MVLYTILLGYSYRITHHSIRCGLAAVYAALEPTVVLVASDERNPVIDSQCSSAGHEWPKASSRAPASTTYCARAYMHVRTGTVHQLRVAARTVRACAELMPARPARNNVAVRRLETRHCCPLHLKPRRRCSYRWATV
jgi:hypothetical protein